MALKRFCGVINKPKKTNFQHIHVSTLYFQTFSEGFINIMMAFYQKIDKEKEDSIVFRVYGDYSDTLKRFSRETDFTGMQVSQMNKYHRKTFQHH